MEGVGFQYNSLYKIIICLEHEIGLNPTGIETHLRNIHREWRLILYAVLHEVSDLTPSPVADLPLLSDGMELIPGLAVARVWHCQLADCNDERQLLSSHL